MLSDPKLSRRKILVGAGGLSVSGLSGCLGTSGNDFTPIEADSIPGEDDIGNDLNVWSNYYTYRDWAIPEFSEQFGVDNITSTGFVTAGEWFGEVQSGTHSIDSVGASGNEFVTAIDQGNIEPLPIDLMDGWDALAPYAKDIAEEWYSDDEGQIYGIPRARTVFPSLTYNEEEFDSPPDSWDILWDEEYADNMFMPDIPQTACQIGALYTGQDPIDPDDFDEIQEVLEQQLDLNVTLWSDYNQARSNFVNEDVVVGPLLDGQTYLGRFERGEAPINYTIPEEGTLWGSQAFVIPSGAPNPETALAYTDFVSKPDSIKHMFLEQGYMPPLPDYMDLYSDEIESGDLTEEEVEFMQWSEQDEERLIHSAPLSSDVRERYDEIWTRVTG